MSARLNCSVRVSFASYWQSSHVYHPGDRTSIAAFTTMIPNKELEGQGPLLPLTNVDSRVKAPSLNTYVPWLRTARGAVKGVAHCLSLRNRRPKTTHQQTESPLFRLPPELRQVIWEYALAPNECADAVHFHVYDDVYNSCTYDNPMTKYKPTIAHRRRHPTQMTLLMTCRGIHNEALQYLYDNTQFTLVLLPGIPGPRKNLQTRQCRWVDRVQDCRELFNRMRNITIVVQPGIRAETKKYVARINNLLSALDNGRHLSSLCLLFNFHVQMPHYDPQDERRGAFIEAFYPTARTLKPRVESRKLKISIKAWSFDRESWDPRFLMLRTLFTGKIGSWHPLVPRDDEVVKDPSHQGENKWCQQRGTFGRPSAAHQPVLFTSRRERYALTGAAAAAWFLTWPVALPVCIGSYCVRKAIKGEERTA